MLVGQTRGTAKMLRPLLEEDEVLSLMCGTLIGKIQIGLVL
jgi:hypothetical protein